MSREIALESLGEAIATARAAKGFTQEQVGSMASGSSRSQVAHLEQGQKLPAALQLASICELLDVPRRKWWAATHPKYLEAADFQSWTSELIGREISLNALEPSAQFLAVDQIDDILTSRRSEVQTHAAFNAILTFYGEKGISWAFFEKFLGKAAFAGNSEFGQHVRAYQKVAIQIFGSFRYAFKQMRDLPPDQLSQRLSVLQPKPDDAHTHRLPFRSIDRIAPERLDDLGYISVARVKRDRSDRQELRDKLGELITLIRSNVDDWQGRAGPKRLNRVNALLGIYGRNVHHLNDGALFGRVNLQALESEALTVLPDEDQLAQIDATQRVGLRNLAAYLVEPYMDVYVATSMRERADFVSVDNFVSSLFGADGVTGSPELENLYLRYFNPTQSWIDDRVAKGLVEALMLRRAAITIYMAQKSDTFGKDSEASVSLGQGKPVVIYVPKLTIPRLEFDSSSAWSMSDLDLEFRLRELGSEADEGADQQAKFELLLTALLVGLDGTSFLEVLRRHWADYDLYGELSAIPEEEERTLSRSVLDAASSKDVPAQTDISEGARRALIVRLVAITTFFEKRAKTFREIHPLALQVILSTGVLNGIVVVRSADQCARIVRQLLLNDVQTELVADGDNYRLAEKETGSVLRVISTNKLLTNSFWTHYFSDPPHR